MRLCLGSHGVCEWVLFELYTLMNCKIDYMYMAVGQTYTMCDTDIYPDDMSKSKDQMTFSLVVKNSMNSSAAACK